VRVLCNVRSSQKFVSQMRLGFEANPYHLACQSTGKIEVMDYQVQHHRYSLNDFPLFLFHRSSSDSTDELP
jgi:hypothetical protein